MRLLPAQPRLAREGFMPASPEKRPNRRNMLLPKTGLTNATIPKLVDYSTILCPPERRALREIVETAEVVRENGHVSDRGVQYVSIRYTERLAEAGIEPSVGSVGDSYDNALAETINGLYKTEVIHRCGPWRSFEAVEMATLEWVDWFNNRRLLEPIGNIPPAEAEARYYAQINELAMVA